MTQGWELYAYSNGWSIQYAVLPAATITDYSLISLPIDEKRQPKVARLTFLYGFYDSFKSTAA
jgi:hypothetical protein